MAKTIIKEIIIVLLLCLAIILLLGILLYEYVPMAKTIPNPVSYTTPENVKQELADSSSIDDSQIIRTYEVDSTDLNNYKRIQDYKPGKANPFSSYDPTADNTTNSTNGTNTTNATSGNSGSADTTSGGNTASGGANSKTGNGNSSNNNEGTTTSGGRFFQDKGTK